MIAFALMLLAADPDPVKPPNPATRKGALSAQIHSEPFTRPLDDGVQAFRVDYKASLKWELSERKDCSLIRCHTVCDLTIRNKILSRQVWWLPVGRPPLLAEDAPGEREYPGGLITYGRACKNVDDQELAHAVAERLRPYQFADEMIKDRPLRDKAADNFLVLYPPVSPSAAEPQAQ
jgi:hypothetical protein